MSSFTHPHRMYLFGMKNGKKKLVYGQTPQDALEIQSYRLSEQEMAQIDRDDCQPISPRDIQQYVHLLG
ncbi:MAG: hypothetical protein ACOYZ7_08880 [Chloroflexota bacterium]